MAISYSDEAHAASGTCAHLSSYAVSEITPQALSSFSLFAVRTASDEKLGGSLGTSLLIQYSMWIGILLAYDHSYKAISEQMFAVVACLPYVATVCTKLCAICDHYTWRTWKNHKIVKIGGWAFVQGWALAQEAFLHRGYYYSNILTPWLLLF